MIPVVTPTVPAQLGYDCLNSVPLGKEAAIELVDSLVPYLEWQSGKCAALSWHFNCSSALIRL